MVAIDGKTVRRSFDHGREQSALHVVSAWASEQGLVLGQRCVDGKSNEITAVPELLDQLALENSIVTLDAMGGAGQEGSVGEADGRPAEGHRLLEAHGVQSHVVDPSSIAVNRRSRRAELPKVLPAPAGGMATEGKTDRIDAEAMLRTLMAW